MRDIVAEDNHVYTLVKLITASYLKIRLHHLAKERSRSLSKEFIRQKLTKLILFNHQ